MNGPKAGQGGLGLRPRLWHEPCAMTKKKAEQKARPKSNREV